MPGIQGNSCRQGGGRPSVWSPDTGLEGEREGVMTRIHIIVLVCSLAVLVGGCGAPSQSSGLAVDSTRPVGLKQPTPGLMCLP